MNTAAFYYQDVASAQTMRALAIAVGILVLVGVVWGGSLEKWFSYMLVLSAAVLPTFLWIRKGASGIPILPVVSSAYIPYFGWPIISGYENTREYGPSEILLTAFTVALFLVTAAFAWRLIAGRVRPQQAVTPSHLNQSRIVPLLSLGLLVGVTFHLATISGWLEGAGSYFGLMRSISVTFVTVACFLTGVARAEGLLRGGKWALSTVGVAVLIALSWSSLFLVGGIVYAMAVLFGYVITARRIPWLVTAAAIATVTVLHAGKAEMRDEYWGAGTNSGGISSVAQLPGLAAEWVAKGVTAIATGSVQQSAIDRTALLQMLLRVQNETPDRIDFLMGKTYALLPAIILPRFLESDKPASQAGMDLLNIRYGILSAEDVTATAIGWGLVAEAYANFGYYGVIGMALLFGLFCGWLQYWSANAATMSLPTLMSIAAMMTLINVELDFIQIVSTLFQSSVSVLIFFAAYRTRPTD